VSDIAQPDVSTDDGFMASLANDLGYDPSIAEDEPVSAAPTTPDPGTTDEGSDADNSDADGGEVDWQAQYKELQTLMGRMSNELGELRKAVGTTDETPEDDDLGYTPTLVTSEVEMEIESAIERSGGEQVALWAAQNRPDLYDVVLEQWALQSEKDSFAALRFDQRFQAALMQQQQTAVQEQQAATSSQLEQSLQQELGTLAQEYGLEVGNEDVDNLLADSLGSVPAPIQALVVSQDATEREAGLRVVLQLAAAKASAAPSGVDPARDAALAAARGAASVGSGSLRPPGAGGPPQPPADSEAGLLQALKEKIASAPSTSIAEGLTFGKQ